MKTTVIKASKDLAERISRQLLSYPSAINPDRTIFIRVETERGFKIQNRNTKNPVRVFEYWDSPDPRIEYNEQIISINK